jgi:DNA-binding NtrC family response regulator
MVAGLTILIADRNPHIRDYLGREMRQEGHQVRLAKSALEVLDCLSRGESFDLLIVDPDLPDKRQIRLIERLRKETPSTPVIIHTYTKEFMTPSIPTVNGVVVEKSGSSIEGLKTFVSSLIRKRDEAV